MRVIFSGGGSGGHIYPALAIYHALLSRNAELEELFVGTSPSMEANICPREGVAFQAISSRGFRRKLSFDTLKTVAVAGKGVWQAGGIVRSFQPDLVIGTGGYVAGPVLLQAALHGVPTLIHEQNALPSLTNRILSRFVDGIALSFAEAADHLPKKKLMRVTGNPVRQDILAMTRPKGQQELGLDPQKKTILIIQGSNGSATVNQIICRSLPQLLQRKDWQLIFVTGQRDYDSVRSVLAEMKLSDAPGLQLVPYLYNVAAALAAADIIISRAGGMMAEINAVGLPAIYVPSPYVADNHQEYNARAVEDVGAAVMIREKELSPEKLFATLSDLLSSPRQLSQMREKALQLARPQAAEHIADLAEELLSLRSKSR